MVVSIGQVLRIEAPFTDDLDEVQRTLRRMTYDGDLYRGHYDRLTERRFFDRVMTLFDLLDFEIKANPKYGSEKKGQPTTYYLSAAPEPIRVV